MSNYYEMRTFHATAQMAEQLEETHEMLEDYISGLQVEAQKQKLLKSALTRYTALMDALDEVKDPLLKCHLYVIHLFKREPDFDLISLHSDDIPTQKEARLQLARLKELGQELMPLEEQYMASPYAKLFNEIKDYQDFEKSYGLKSRPIFFAMNAPADPILLILGTVIVLGGGLFMLSAFIYATIESKEIGIGVAMCGGTLGFMALLLFLLAKQFKKRKAYKEREAVHVQELSAWNMKKKEMDEALKNHRIHRYINNMKKEYPEYVTVWDRIKTIESHFGEGKKNNGKKKTAEEEVQDFLRM